MIRALAAGAVALILGGCASSGMDQAQCRTADWTAIGYEDGSQGRGGTAIGAHRKSCAEHGVRPDFEAYMAGHDRGIKRFCRPQNGYRLGTRGYRYNGVCPVALEQSFLQSHAEGYGLYERRASVNRLRNQITRKQERSRTIERLLAKKTAALMSFQTLPARRLSLGVEIKQLTEERIDIDRLIGDLEQDLAQAQQDYQGYRESLAHR